jgi:phosphoserine phosphatase
MKRTDTFAIDARAGNGDICAAVRVTRWLPGVIWSGLAKSRTAQFTIRYDDRTTSAAAIVAALGKRGYCCAVITALPASLLSNMRCLPIKQARQFRTSHECYCRAQLLPCPVCGVLS